MNHPIRAERERQGLTIEALADKAGVNERSIRRAEAWESVSAETRAKIADALGVAVAELWQPVGIGSVIAGVDGAARIAGMFGGEYVLQPLEFAPPIQISDARLKARYAVDVVAPSTRPERHGYEALAEASRRNALQLEAAQQRAAAKQAEIENAEAVGWQQMASALERGR